jgi:hypothetical protein
MEYASQLFPACKGRDRGEIMRMVITIQFRSILRDFTDGFECFIFNFFCNPCFSRCLIGTFSRRYEDEITRPFYNRTDCVVSSKNVKDLRRDRFGLTRE